MVAEEEFDIDAVRRDWIGASLGRSAGRYPVEYDPIRRYTRDIVKLAVWIENDRVGVATPGTAVVRLSLPGALS